MVAPQRAAGEFLSLGETPVSCKSGIFEKLFQALLCVLCGKQPLAFSQELIVPSFKTFLRVLCGKIVFISFTGTAILT